MIDDGVVHPKVHPRLDPCVLQVLLQSALSSQEESVLLLCSAWSVLSALTDWIVKVFSGTF